MHKNIPVLEMEIDEEVSAIAKIKDVYNFDHLPVGTELTKGQPNRRSLNEWWTGRAIPASRSGLRDALETMKISSPSVLLTKCFGLSLSDQYWVRPAAKPMEWKDVNFFENEFSEDVGNALFGRAPEGAELDLLSPDNTSDGWLKKKWVVADGKRMLVKGGSPILYQEPLNEMLAAAIARRLNIPHTPYSVIWENGQPLSVCEDFITSDTDLVPAWRIHQTMKKPGHMSGYQHYVACCEKLGIPGIVQRLNEMLVVDYLTVNGDRHYNNFGAIRNAETLEWLGAAPIFDTGTSVWYDSPNGMIRPRVDVACKPFRSKHGEQIKLVSDFSWVDIAALHGIDEEFAEILKPSEYIDDARRTILCNAVRIRVEMLEELIACA